MELSLLTTFYLFLVLLIKSPDWTVITFVGEKMEWTGRRQKGRAFFGVEILNILSWVVVQWVYNIFKYIYLKTLGLVFS